MARLVDEGCVLLSSCIFAPSLECRQVVNENLNIIWFCYRFENDHYNSETLRINRQGLLTYENRQIVRTWQYRRVGFEIFCVYVTNFDQFVEERFIAEIPYMKLARRAVRPMGKNDSEISVECFGKIIPNAQAMEELLIRDTSHGSSLADIAVRRRVASVGDFVPMYVCRLWASESNFTIRDMEWMRECILCSVRFRTGLDSIIQVKIKVRNNFSDFTLMYRGAQEHADNMTGLLLAETKFSGMIMDFGHSVSWYNSSTDLNCDILNVIRLLRYSHRYLRSSILGVGEEELKLCRDALAHCIRLAYPLIREMSVKYRLLNIYSPFDDELTTEMSNIEGMTIYRIFDEWVCSFWNPSEKQLKLLFEAEKFSGIF